MPDAPVLASSRAALVGGTALWFLLTAGPIIQIRTQWSLDGPIAEDPAYLLVVLGAALVCAVVLVRGGFRPAELGADRTRVAMALAALVGVIAVSSLWSLDPGATALHALRLAGTVVIGTFLALRLSPLAQIVSLWVAVQVGCAWSTVQIQRLAVGSLDDEGSWVGIFVNRNSLGLVSALGITTSVLLGAAAWRSLRETQRIIVLVVVALAALADARLLIGSGSGTPVAVLAALVAIGAVVMVMRRTAGASSARLGDAAAVVMVAGAVLSSFVLSWVAGAFGRGGNLSRRVPLWDFVVDKIGERPLHGWGYLGEWDDRGFRRDMREFVRGRDLFSAHNTVLEVALGVGVIGLAVFVVTCVLVARRVWRGAMVGAPVVAALWPLVALSWFLLEGTMESFLVADTLPTTLFVVAGLSAIAGDGASVDRGRAVEAAAIAQEAGQTDEDAADRP